jgi:hypothetical protein
MGVEWVGLGENSITKENKDEVGLIKTNLY